jgi:putative Mg2+ transporter-C (MgtC) family protein
VLPEYEIIGRVVLAIVLAGAIGFEREYHGKSAGLRTYSLVGMGAGMFTIASIIGFDGPDESRVAAQIVTGVGFLGAGAIFREGIGVEGLTTAAGLWTAAAIGMASGSGEYLLAVTGSVAALVVLFGLYAIDEWVRRQKAAVPAHVEVFVEAPSRMADIVKFSRRIDPGIRQLGLERQGDGTAVLTLAVVEEKARLAAEMMASLKGVSGARVVPALEKRRFPTE